MASLQLRLSTLGGRISRRVCSKGFRTDLGRGLVRRKGRRRRTGRSRRGIQQREGGGGTKISSTTTARTTAAAAARERVRAETWRVASRCSQKCERVLGAESESVSDLFSLHCSLPVFFDQKKQDVLLTCIVPHSPSSLYVLGHDNWTGRSRTVVLNFDETRTKAHRTHLPLPLLFLALLLGCSLLRSTTSTPSLELPLKIFPQPTRNRTQDPSTTTLPLLNNPPATLRPLPTPTTSRTTTPTVDSPTHSIKRLLLPPTPTPSRSASSPKEEEEEELSLSEEGSVLVSRRLFLIPGSRE